MFPDKRLGFRLELVDEFTKIAPSAFGSFIGHHQGLLACIKCFRVFFLRVWKVLRFFYNVNAELDKTEMLMNLKTERYQRK